MRIQCSVFRIRWRYADMQFMHMLAKEAGIATAAQAIASIPEHVLALRIESKPDSDRARVHKKHVFCNRFCNFGLPRTSRECAHVWVKIQPHRRHLTVRELAAEKRISECRPTHYIILPARPFCHSFGIRALSGHVFLHETREKCVCNLQGYRADSRYYYVRNTHLLCGAMSALTCHVLEPHKSFVERVRAHCSISDMSNTRK